MAPEYSSSSEKGRVVMLISRDLRVLVNVTLCRALEAEVPGGAISHPSIFTVLGQSAEAATFFLTPPVISSRNRVGDRPNLDNLCCSRCTCRASRRAVARLPDAHRRDPPAGRIYVP